MSSRRQGALGVHLLAFVLILVGVAGCGSSQPAADVSQADWAKSNDAKSNASAQSTIEVIDTAKLKPLGDPLAALDDGRVTISPPADWVLGPRNKERLAMFQLEPDDAYPSIILTVSAVRDSVSLSPENVDAFVAELQSQLEAEMAAKNFKLAEPVNGVQIGDFLGVEYMRTAKAHDTRLERCFLETVRAGRRYQLEMRTRAGSLHRFRPYLYAVAAGMKFGPAAAATSEPTPSTAPATSTEPTPAAP